MKSLHNPYTTNSLVPGKEPVSLGPPRLEGLECQPTVIHCHRGEDFLEGCRFSFLYLGVSQKWGTFLGLHIIRFSCLRSILGSSNCRERSLLPTRVITCSGPNLVWLVAFHCLMLLPYALCPTPQEEPPPCNSSVIL